MTNIRHTKFDLNANERSFPSIPSDGETFKRVLLTIDTKKIPYIVQAYFRDRTPAAFADKPMLWQALRAWLSSRIIPMSEARVSPWEWGLSGSASIGFSASPHKFGTPFGGHSDLDLFAVNADLFEKVSLEARKFAISTSQASKYGAARETLTIQLRRGLLIDTKHIPSWDEYPLNSMIHNEISIIVDKLRIEGYTVKRSFVRVYKDWEALTNQLRLNLTGLRQELLNQ